MQTITICGSMFFYEEMKEFYSDLTGLGYLVNMPISFQEMGIIEYDKYTQEEGRELKTKYNLIRNYNQKILESDGILVVNYEKRGIKDYIGGNTLLELGFAYVNNRDIFMVNEAPEVSYKAEIEAMQPMIVGDEMEKIAEYYEKLPKAYVSSANELKVNATSFGFRKVGKIVDAVGIKTDSKVSEQPYSFEEAYEGARNRMKDLKRQIKDKDYEYLVSIESGNIKPFSDRNTFGFSICIIEDRDGNEKMGILTDVEIPKAMTDLVPSKYPDLGVLVQKKYKTKSKDPFEYITNGKLTRLELLTNSVSNVAATF